MSGPPRRDEHGLAATGAVALAGIVVGAAVLVALLGQVLISQRVVNAAADLAALAGAGADQRGQSACAAAVRIARLNGAELGRCAVSGRMVSVVATIEVRLPWSPRFELRGQAVAGPR